MASKARKAFNENSEDITRLLDIHKSIGGDQRGRRYELEVLNKSAVVLITSFWEAFCEDLAAEAVDHIVQNAPSADGLTKEIKKDIALELKADRNEIAVWSLSGEGWREILKARLKHLQEERNRRLNTPKSDNIDELFFRSIGCERVSDSWDWHKTTPSQARKKLDRFVTLRGDIAHRGAAAESCKKNQVESYRKLTGRIVDATERKVNAHVKQITGTPLST